MRSIGIKTNVVKLSRSVIHHVDIPPMYAKEASHLEEPPASVKSFEPLSPSKLSNPPSPAKLAETPSRGAKVNQRLQESLLSLNLSEFDISMLNQQLDSSRIVSIENTVRDIHSLLLKWQCVKPNEVPPSTNKVKTALSSVSKEYVSSKTTLSVSSNVQSSFPSISNDPLPLICNFPVRLMPSTIPESPLFPTIPESPLSSNIIQEGIESSEKIESFDKLMSRSFCDTIEDLVSLDNSTTRLLLSEIENDCLDISPSPQSKSWNVFLNNDV